LPWVYLHIKLMEVIAISSYTVPFLVLLNTQEN
jgi:hypothetical protein